MVPRASTEKLLKGLVKFGKYQKLPGEVKELLEACLESEKTIPFPIVTFKENDWIIASTPIMDLSAQGKTENEAIKNLEAMIDDCMTDPDIEKPKMKTMISMEIGIRSIPMKFPIDKIAGVGNNPGKNTPIAAQ